MEKNKRLLRILTHAYETVPFYNNVINSVIEEEDITDETFKKIPYFTKQSIRELGWANFVDNSYLSHNNKLNPKLRNARLERTSGTSGAPMDILWKNDDYFSSSMNHWKFRNKNYGITPKSKMCTSAKTIPGGGLFFINRAGNKLLFSIRNLNFETVPQIIKKINEFQPDWLYLQNSVLYTLVWFCRKLKLSFPKSIKYIEYMGEPICEYYRSEIEKEFQVRTCNMYGCTETNGISYECAEGHNHIISDNVIVEIIDDDGRILNDGNTGFVCVTGLHNTAMPIIKYRLDDIASINSFFKCPCGNTNPTIEIKAARMTEYLILDDHSIYEKAELYCPINSGVNVFATCENDIFFNLNINSLDNYEIWIYGGENCDQQIERMFQQMFEVYGLPNIKFKLRYTKEIDKSKPAGILRYIDI